MRVGAVLGAILSLIAAIVVVVWISGGGPSSETSGTTAAVEDAKKDPAEQELRQNPFPKPEKGPFPKVEVVEDTHNFGVTTVYEGPSDGVSGRHTFVVKNVGEGVLKLAKGPSTCQCTMSSLTELEVPPGESTEIELAWKPEVVTDEFHKQASIWTNDPALWESEPYGGEGKLVFSIVGKVVDAVRVEPSHFSLGTVNEEEPTVLKTLIYSEVHDDLQLEVAKTSSEFVHVDLQPASEETLQEREGKFGWEATITVEPRMSIGNVRESVTFATSGPEEREVTVSIDGHRQGPFSIAGRYWDPARAMINFGRLTAAEGGKTTLHLYAAAEEEPLELQVASKDPEFLNVEVTRGESPGDGRDRFAIHVELPGGHPPGRRAPGNIGKILLKTNREEVPEIKIHVAYESR